MALLVRYVDRDADGLGDGTTPTVGGATGAWSIGQVLFATTGAAGAGLGGAGLVPSATDGILVLIKAGTYTINAFRTLRTTTAQLGSPIVLRGYWQTPPTAANAVSDAYLGRTLGGLGPLDTSRYPVLQFGANNLDLQLANLVVDCIRIEGAVANNLVSVTSNAAYMVNCDVRNTISGLQTSATAVRLGNASGLINCDVQCDASSADLVTSNVGAVQSQSGNTRVLGCRLNAPLSRGIYTPNNNDGADLVAYNQFIGGGSAIGACELRGTFSGSVDFLFNTVRGFVEGVRFQNAGLDEGGVVCNNYFVNVTTAVANPSGRLNCLLLGNRIRGGAASAGLGDWPSLNEQPAGLDDLVNAAIADFRVRSSRGGYVYGLAAGAHTPRGLTGRLRGRM